MRLFWKYCIGGFLRLFVATPVEFAQYDTLKQHLSKYIDAKWVEKENLHLTHFFIGEADPKQYQKKLIVPNEKITVKRVSLFNEKILYLKANSLHIDSINRQFNGKNFKPHITLCRIKQIYDLRFFKEIKKFRYHFQIPFEVYLYQSTLTPTGPIYKKIYHYKSSKEY